jgi:Ni/Co efflux regulator RcnB
MEISMSSKAVISSILALAIAASSGLAFGQYDRDRNHNDQQAQRGGQNDRRDEGGRPSERRGERRDERGAGPNHAFYRGQRLPPEYRKRQYVVNDWRGQHLNAPPRGYHWVRTCNDYVLAAIATGVILQLLLNN